VDDGPTVSEREEKRGGASAIAGAREGYYSRAVSARGAHSVEGRIDDTLLALAAVVEGDLLAVGDEPRVAVAELTFKNTRQ
jgi:hypothetical protein